MRRFALGATLSLFLALSFGSVAYGSELNEEPGVLGEGQAALADQSEALPGAASAAGDTGSDGGAQSENSGSSDLIAGSGNEDASGPEDAVPPTGGSEGDATVVPDGSIGDESDAQAGGNASSDAEDGVGGETSGGSGDEDGSDGSPNPPQDGDSEGDGPQEPAEPEKPAIPEKVEDGAYIIDSSLGKTLDVKSGSKKDKGNVQTYTKNYSAAQRYYIKATGQVGSGEWYYTIKNVNSGKVLDVSGGKKTSGTNVQQYASNNTAAQRWFIRKDVLPGGKVVFRIVNVGSGLALDVSGGSKKNGANVQVYTANGTDAQAWILRKCTAAIDDGAYVLGSGVSGKLVMDVASGSASNGAALQLYQGNKTLAQSFALNYDSSTGYYTITGYGSGKKVDAKGGKSANGTPVQQYVSNGTLAQKWQILKNSDGSVTFVSAIGGKALDVKSGAAKSGARLQLYTRNGTKAQRFFLSATTPVFSGGVVAVYNGANTAMVMDVKSGSRSEGAKLQLYKPNSTFAQKFKISSNGDGTFGVYSIVSGLLVSASNEGVISQQAKSADLHQAWNIVPTKDGHFAFVSVGSGAVLGITGSASQGAGVAGLAQNAGLKGTWNMVSVPLLANGYYTISSALNSGIALDISSASLKRGGNAQLYKNNGTKAQKFYVRHLGNGWYSIANAWSAMYLDVTGGAKKAGTNIQQWTKSSVPAQKWQAVWDGKGGFVFKSALGQFSLGASSVKGSANVKLVSYNVANDNQRFMLAPTSAGNATYADRIAVLDAITGSGLNVFKSLDGLSSQTITALRKAISAYDRIGKSVGFFMMDLTTGAGVSYNIDRKFYSASTIKGPYVASLNKYRPDLLKKWSSVMYPTINVSSNEAYAQLRNALGSSTLAKLAKETHANIDLSSHYIDYSTRNLAKLWVGMADYFMSNKQNAAWCRSVFGSNAAITSRSLLHKTVYAKSGWITEGGRYNVHNEGCVVMDGNRPYVMVIMSNHSPYDTANMKNLMKALDKAHRELVR